MKSLFIQQVVLIKQMKVNPLWVKKWQLLSAILIWSYNLKLWSFLLNCPVIFYTKKSSFSNFFIIMHDEEWCLKNWETNSQTLHMACTQGREMVQFLKWTNMFASVSIESFCILWHGSLLFKHIYANKML